MLYVSKGVTAMLVSAFVLSYWITASCNSL